MRGDGAGEWGRHGQLCDPMSYTVFSTIVRAEASGTRVPESGLEG